MVLSNVPPHHSAEGCCAGVRGVGGTQELSLHSSPLCCEPKTALKSFKKIKLVKKLSMLILGKVKTKEKLSRRDDRPH